jgi:uncharacterized membrane protein
MKTLRELVAVVGLLSAIFVVAFNYRELPQRIPTHFGLSGLADAWGDKSSLWIIVGLTCVLYAIFSLVRFLPPRLINVPVSEEHRAAAIPISLEMIGWVKAEIACMFAYIVWSAVAVVQGNGHGLGVWFLPVTLITIIGTSLFYTLQMRRLGRSDADIIG